MRGAMRAVITAGAKYIDIDVLACGVAYHALLRKLGRASVCVLCGPYNETVPASVRAWNPVFDRVPPTLAATDTFILVDISNPDHLPAFVDPARVVEVWDHRAGFEDYWTRRLGAHNIELVGSCATLIWEQYVKRGMENAITPLDANLLYTAIFSNTLNLQAAVTHERDRAALIALRRHVDLPPEWIARYYAATQAAIMADPVRALATDRKTVVLSGMTFVIGQLELWDARELFAGHAVTDIVQHALGGGTTHWFLTMPSLSEGRTYFVTNSPATQGILSAAFDTTFCDGVAVLPRAALRKEVEAGIRKVCPQESGSDGKRAVSPGGEIR